MQTQLQLKLGLMLGHSMMYTLPISHMMYSSSSQRPNHNLKALPYNACTLLKHTHVYIYMLVGR